MGASRPSSDRIGSRIRLRSASGTSVLSFEMASSSGVWAAARIPSKSAAVFPEAKNSLTSILASASSALASALPPGNAPSFSRAARGHQVDHHPDQGGQAHTRPYDVSADGKDDHPRPGVRERQRGNGQGDSGAP